MSSQAVIELSEAIRARKVISRSNCRVTGKYPGFKSGRMHYWDSPLERDAFRILDTDPRVISFAEQPATIHYDLDGKSHRHIPDIVVQRRGWKEYIEVKADHDASSSEVQARTVALEPMLERHGCGYRVWTATEIRTGCRLSNAVFLLRFGSRCDVPLNWHEAVQRTFSRQKAICWGELTGPAFGPQALRRACRLVLDGVLHIDLYQEIDAGTVVQLGELA